jgi:hypothetical protein
MAQSRVATGSGGHGFDNLVKVTIIPDASEIPASRPARVEALGDRRPASTPIVGGLANPAWKSRSKASHTPNFVSPVRSIAVSFGPASRWKIGRPSNCILR